MNIAVTGGGTGGHFYPAYILYEKLKASDKINEIYYIGSDYGLEKKLASELKLNFILLKARGFIGKSLFNKITSLLLNLFSIIYCLFFFISKKIDAVVAAGGYVSLPPLAAAVILRKKIFIQEQNSYPGITTRLFAFAATKIFISFNDAKKYLKTDDSKLYLTLTPVRDNFFNEAKKINEREKLITILGGSQGSKKINEIIEQTLDYFNENKIYVNWITGVKFYEQYKNRESEYIKIFEYSNDIYKLLAESELIISRAGATSIAEYSVLNKKALFIPFEAATHNHQYYNALAYIRDRQGDIIIEKELTADLLKNRITQLLNNKQKKGESIDINPADNIISEILLSLNK